jgi:hypothetical protein
VLRQNSLSNAVAQPLCVGFRAARVVDLRLFNPRLKGPAAVVPSLRAIDPSRDLSLADARRAFQRVIWKIECEIVLSEFGHAVSVRICHFRSPRLEDLGNTIAIAPRGQRSVPQATARDTFVARERCNTASMLFLFRSVHVQAAKQNAF